MWCKKNFTFLPGEEKKKKKEKRKKKKKRKKKEEKRMRARAEMIYASLEQKRQSSMSPIGCE